MIIIRNNSKNLMHISSDFKTQTESNKINLLFIDI